MRIETKFNCGNHVWIMYNNEPQNIRITMIKVIQLCSTPDQIDVWYTGNFVNHPENKLASWVSGEKVFGSREALLNSFK